MNSFVRFVLSVMAAGMALNLLIVMLANSRSLSIQAREMGQEREQFRALLDDANGRLRRADLAVESQEIGAHGDAISSTLLVRQYRSTGSDQTWPLRVERVVIPGNELCIDGLVLSFDPGFAADAPDLQLLAGRKLAFFGRVYGKEDTAAAKTGDTRFSFMQQWQVPELTRLFPADPRPTFFEQRLWPYIWDIISEPPPVGTGTWTQSDRGVQLNWTAPAEHAVRLEHTYTAYIGPDASLSIEEDAPGVPGLLDTLLDEGRKQREAATQN